METSPIRRLVHLAGPGVGARLLQTSDACVDIVDEDGCQVVRISGVDGDRAMHLTPLGVEVWNQLKQCPTVPQLLMALVGLGPSNGDAPANAEAFHSIAADLVRAHGAPALSQEVCRIISSLQAAGFAIWAE